ncbi:hypothetical protein GCU56_02060 [Geodermatophilus sabuli]|uniref:Uncharacterized protein n=1 Tax=Geodermatophilus sabuli TaxID=1564158 RepID=A0A7K3VVJ9_9ACTN|nr:hypothetical protein [Geodermatophilus sabuli]NEK56659.1 hypothetical protein [Geodermatophilus sabuli]
MQLRRPIAALMTALALFGGGATMTGCQAAGQDQRDGTNDEESVNTDTDDENDDSQDNLPDNSDPEDGAEQDGEDDTQDPD